MWLALCTSDSCVIVPIERRNQSELQHYETTRLRSPIPPQTLAPPQNRNLARTQKRSRYRHRPHRLSQAQASGLPLQLYPSRPTIEALVNQSPRGCFADELADTLHAEVQDPLHDLVRAGRLRRSEVTGRFLYTSVESRQARDQLRTRKTAQSVPLVADASALQISPEELKAAILLFYSLLDEQQRRLFAGLESIKLGHGGDRIVAEFLTLDPHTVARGRQQLLDHKVTLGRTRHSGGGRKPVEKKRPTSSP